MKQVLVRGGKVEIEEAPAPTVLSNGALVRVSHSLISSGTESTFVSGGGTAGFALKKARDPLNIEKFKRKIASVGFRGAIEIAKNKLFEFQVPGYSAAGTILECGPKLEGFRVGDRVACAGGGYACHAEYITVPQQLLTPIPDGVDFEEAAFVALGGIAMQGVRRAEPLFGETFVVMGLGLVGQLTAQIVRAAGCRAICSDPLPERQALAKELGALDACSPDELDARVDGWTGGHGADAVLICAATKNSEVANHALDLCRSRGRVVVVGAVGMNLAREPLYRKELDFRLSCSYGPGRYQPAYEEKGLDYPIGYVRWTEGRNMAEFLRMIAEKRVQVRPLISVVKPVEEAKQAYEAVLSGAGNTIAALISYGAPAEITPAQRRLALKGKPAKAGSVGVAVIGAGGFATAFHLPNLARIPGCHIEAIVTRTGHKAKQAGEKFKARYCTTDYNQVLEDPNVQAVVIATRHNSHKSLALHAIAAGKHVFVEKPLALTPDDCEEICQAVEKAGVLLTVGFNRRFSAFSKQAKAMLSRMTGPKMVLYRINAGPLPPDHWTLDPEVGGGRIIGEGVHFFDLACWFMGEDPSAIQADRVDAESITTNSADNVSVVMRFPGGSLATVIYCCLGHPALSKEYIELYGAESAIVIDDFRGIRFAGLPGKNIKQNAEDKGQYGIMENFIQAIRGEAELEVTARDGLRATRIACEVLAAGSRSGPP